MPVKLSPCKRGGPCNTTLSSHEAFVSLGPRSPQTNCDHLTGSSPERGHCEALSRGCQLKEKRAPQKNCQSYINFPMGGARSLGSGLAGSSLVEHVFMALPPEGQGAVEHEVCQDPSRKNIHLGFLVKRRAWDSSRFVPGHRLIVAPRIRCNDLRRRVARGADWLHHLLKSNLVHLIGEALALQSSTSST